MKLKTLAAGIGLLVLAASCSEDVTEEINSGPVISFTTRMSRAEQIYSSVDNLSEFKVYAEAENFAGLFISDETATKENGVFNMTKTYRWPSSADNIQFWAYAPVSLNNAKVEIKGNHSASIEITPTYYHATTTGGSASSASSGKTHQDLITAYTKAGKSSVTNSTVPLQFHHALSQIELNAMIGSGSAHEYSVYIKGAWFVNVNGTGKLVFNNTDGTSSWNAVGTKTQYGELYSAGKPLGPSVNSCLLGENQAKSGLMVVPQSVPSWDVKSDKSNTNKGAYILLLCRVEVEHAGTDHEGKYIKNKEDGSGHVHQMFPVTNTGSYDAGHYGYVCVPLNDVKWEKGYKYVYNLEFCGKTSGAGLYPPELPDGLPIDGDIITARPSGKNVGDPVLDEPIKFSTTIEGWTNSPTDIPMN